MKTLLAGPGTMIFTSPDGEVSLKQANDNSDHQ